MKLLCSSYVPILTFTLLTSAFKYASGKIQMAGVNLPGFAMDMSVLGSAYSAFEAGNCYPSYAVHPTVESTAHYQQWRAQGFNLFRLPIGWQHVQESLGGKLNETTMKDYDALVHSVTSNGSHAIVDIHNYARWYCSTINQPELSLPGSKENVTNQHFADLWSKLSLRYRSNPRIIFELMNEPHDLDVIKWGETAQAAIDAIRNVTRDHHILLPGTQYARLSDWMSSSLKGVGPGQVKDPAGKLIYDFHQYFDDSQGSIGICEPWEVFEPDFKLVTSTLRKANSTAFLTEFNGGPWPSCIKLLSSLMEFLEGNDDVWRGWTAWGPYVLGTEFLSLNKTDATYKLTEVLLRYAPLATQ